MRLSVHSCRSTLSVRQRKCLVDRQSRRTIFYRWLDFKNVLELQLHAELKKQHTVLFLVASTSVNCCFLIVTSNKINCLCSKIAMLKEYEDGTACRKRSSLRHLWHCSESCWRWNVCAIIYQLTKQLTAITLRVSLFAFSLCSVTWNFFVLMPR